MPLARIITRSHQCSRELALDLLERGYTVEVVSPDNIPDNMADLELRVEAGPDKQLIANVEVHDGDHSASLDFVHYLKTPLADFVRRTPEPQESAELQTIPIAFNAEVSVEDLEAPVEVSPSSAYTGGDVAEPNHAFGFNEGVAGTVEESARLVPVAEPEQSWAVAQQADPVASRQGVSSTVTAHPDLFEPAVVSPSAPRDRGRSGSGRGDGGWRWRTAFTVASAVVLALVVRFGISHAGKSPSGNSPVAAVVKIAAPPSDVKVSNPVSREIGNGKMTEKNSTIVATGDSPKISGVPAPQRDTTSAGNTAPPPIQSPAVKPESLVPTEKPKVATHRNDGLVARDTVTYLDKNFDKSAAPTARRKNPVRKKAHGSKQSGATVATRKSSPQPSGSNQHRNNGIAPDTVTYLDKAPTPKTTKQNE